MAGRFQGGQIKTRTRKATYANPLASAVFHSITAEDEFIIRKQGTRGGQRWVYGKEMEDWGDEDATRGRRPS